MMIMCKCFWRAYQTPCLMPWRQFLLLSNVVICEAQRGELAGPITQPRRGLAGVAPRSPDVRDHVFIYDVLLPQGLGMF